MLARALGLSLAIAFACPIVAFGADKFPDVKGKWVGKSVSIVSGTGGHWPSGKGTFDKPGLYEKDVVIDVTGQQDRRFWGVTTLSGGSEKTEEPFIGALAGDEGRDFFAADTDGYVLGHLNDDNNKLSYCYVQAGGGKSGSSVVSCTEVKRER